MAVSFATASSCFVISINLTSVAHVLFLVGVAPFIAAILGWLFLREAVKRRTWIAIGAVCVGIGIMESDSSGQATLVGDLFGLLMATGFAVGTVIMRRYHQVRMTPAAALAAAFASLFALGQGASLAVGGTDLMLLILFGVGQLGLGLAFYVAGARLIPAAEAALCSLLELGLGPLWVWLIYSERPDVLSLIGGGFIIGALVINTLLDRNAAPTAPPLT
jgi:drug/metabolite transporter (DMT)-like permease